MRIKQKMDPELNAIPDVLHALENLDQQAQRRILDYVRSRLNVGMGVPELPYLGGPARVPGAR
jgi:hypothetical protein